MPKTPTWDREKSFAETDSETASFILTLNQIRIRISGLQQTNKTQSLPFEPNQFHFVRPLRMLRRCRHFFFFFSPFPIYLLNFSNRFNVPLLFCWFNKNRKAFDVHWHRRKNRCTWRLVRFKRSKFLLKQTTMTEIEKKIHRRVSKPIAHCGLHESSNRKLNLRVQNVEITTINAS